MLRQSQLKTLIPLLSDPLICDQRYYHLVLITDQITGEFCHVEFIKQLMSDGSFLWSYQGGILIDE
ncbi:MAG: hypothetical protein R3321_03365 [Nitrososphaeraceae archaeon]|nr:hypothetical protein [Nitrososphaeraceae archaeon]